MKRVDFVARAIEGPHRPVPAGSNHNIAELREVRWAMLSEQEKGVRLAEAQAAIDAATAYPADTVWNSTATAPKDRRILVQCSDGAPFPVMIARWNGTRFNSLDEGMTGGMTWTIKGWLPLPEPGPVEDDTYSCSFCGKSQHDVEKLIAGPSTFICNECVDMCNEIVEGK